MVYFWLQKKKNLTINKFGIILEHKTFKGFTNVSDNLGRKYDFNMANGGKTLIKVPLSWKKSLVKEL